MNTRAGKGEYILQAHMYKIFFEDSMGGLNPPNPPSGYATGSFNDSYWWPTSQNRPMGQALNFYLIPTHNIFVPYTLRFDSKPSFIGKF